MEAARAVVITGMGAVSSLGFGVPALARILEETPISGIGRVRHFDTTGFTTELGAVVPGSRAEEPAIVFARAAAKEALDRAQLRVPRTRIALVLGSSLGTSHERMYEITDRVAEEMEIRGPKITVSTACSSSSNAIGLARDLVLAGVVDAAIAGGTDVLSPELFAGFHALGVLSKEPCAPFSFPEGTTLGEGAGFVVLERASDAQARGAKPLAWLLGYGLSCDAHHPTTPDPSGMGVARAIRGALVDAGIDARAIGYVNAHATGTSANDPAEMLGIAAAIGREIPVSGSKSFLGHAQGAAGVLEIIVTVLGLGAQRLPPTSNVHELRRSAPKDVVPVARPHAYDVALSLSSAFAGANTAVVLSSKSFVAPRRDACKIHVLGSAWLEAETLRRDLPMADPRGMDPSTRFLASVCARALADAAVKPSGDRRDRTGLIAAVSGYSAESAAEFRRSIRERGLPKVNATAFAKMVLNAPAGAAATLLSLRGATSTLTTGRGGGALAVAYAAELLSHGANDVLVAASVDERTESDGAAALVLGHEHEGRGPTIASWVIGPPGGDPLPAALDRAGLASADVVVSDDEPELARFLSAGSAIACVRALEHLRSGARSAAVVTKGGGTSVALVFLAEVA